MAPYILIANIEKQLLHNRLTVFNDAPPTPFIYSLLRLVPKYNGGFRRIHNLSYLRKNSVNDYIPDVYSTLEYTTFNEVITAVLTMGRGAILVKKDLLDTFRYILILRLN